MFNMFKKLRLFVVSFFSFVTALMLTSTANAALLDFSAATAELDGVKTTVIAIIGVLVGLIGIGLAWAYFKRTAK